MASTTSSTGAQAGTRIASRGNGSGVAVVGVMFVCGSVYERHNFVAVTGTLALTGSVSACRMACHDAAFPRFALAGRSVQGHPPVQSARRSVPRRCWARSTGEAITDRRGMGDSAGRATGAIVRRKRMRTPPWAGVIPEEDLAAFPGLLSAYERKVVLGDRPALVVVDMTREFVEAGYRTSCAVMGPGAVQHARRLLDAVRAEQLPVFFTKSRPDGKMLPDAFRHRWRYYSSAQSAVESQSTVQSLPPGDEIVDELAPRDSDTIIYKYSNPSGFFGTPLAPALLQLGVNTIIVVGASTSGCVRATAVDAFSYGLQVVLAHDACADRSAISHKISLFDMHMKYADVAATDEVIRWLGTKSDSESPDSPAH